MTSEVPALRPVPSSIEDKIRVLRRCPARCPMIETLDQRMAMQRALVEKVLKDRGWEVEQIQSLSRLEAEELEDHELRLCWHILRDIDYIDSLR